MAAGLSSDRYLGSIAIGVTHIELPRQAFHSGQCAATAPPGEANIPVKDAEQYRGKSKLLEILQPAFQGCIPNHDPKEWRSRLQRFEFDIFDPARIFLDRVIADPNSPDTASYYTMLTRPASTTDEWRASSQILVAVASGRAGDLTLDELQRPKTFLVCTVHAHDVKTGNELARFRIA